MLKQIIEFIVKELVENPSLVRIEQNQDDGKIVFTIYTDEKDLGKVIGKGGQTIRSIRSVATTLNEQEGCQIVVDVSK